VAKWLDRLAYLALFGALRVLLSGFFGWLRPAFDTIAHCRWHAGLAHRGICLHLLFRRLKLAAMTRAAGTFLTILASLPGMPPRTMIASA